MASRVLAHSPAQQQPLPMLPKAPGPAVSSAMVAAALPEPLLRMVLAVPALGLPQIRCSHPELLAAPWPVGWPHDRGMSLKRKRQLQEGAKGEIPKPGTSCSSLKPHSSQGEFQADILIVFYLILRAETCWKLDNSPCLVRIHAALDLILNTVTSFIFQPSGGSVWTFHQEAVVKPWYSLGLAAGHLSP